MNKKELTKIISLPIIFASLCCLSPLILFLLGITTASFATSLADNLYYNYAWAFRALGLITLSITLFLYFHKTKNICTLNEAKKRKNEILNTIFIVLIVAILGYLVWLYVIVEFIGKYFKLW